MSIALSRIPSIDFLRGFVAVGRRMSITLAAQDLFLTQSAISQQIRSLEELLGHRTAQLIAEHDDNLRAILNCLADRFHIIRADAQRVGGIAAR